MTEEVLQLRVEERLRLYGYEFFHDRDSRRNRAGLPDIVAARDGRVILLELKSERGRLSPAQQRWRDALQDHWALVRPSDLLSGAVDALLR